MNSQLSTLPVYGMSVITSLLVDCDANRNLHQVLNGHGMYNQLQSLFVATIATRHA